MVHMMMKDMMLYVKGLRIRVAKRSWCIIVRISHLGQVGVNNICTQSEIRCMSLIGAREIPKGTTSHICGVHLGSLGGDHSLGI